MPRVWSEEIKIYARELNNLTGNKAQIAIFEKYHTTVPVKTILRWRYDSKNQPPSVNERLLHESMRNMNRMKEIKQSVTVGDRIYFRVKVPKKELPVIAKGIVKAVYPHFVMVEAQPRAIEVSWIDAVRIEKVNG